MQKGDNNVLRTTDAKNGSYALELKTVAGTDQNNNFLLYSGYVEDGLWNNNTGTFTGGFPYPYSSGILTFWYKYAPADPNDSANINITLKQSDFNIGGNGMKLRAASSYTYVELPFSTNGTIADTAMINISSSFWQGQNWAQTATSYVGADLKIDDMALVVPTAGIHSVISSNIVSFYPNPMQDKGVFTISPDTKLSGLCIRIYNLSGEVIRIVPVTSYVTTLNRAGLMSGMYFYELTQVNTPLMKGKIIVE